MDIDDPLLLQQPPSNVSQFISELYGTPVLYNSIHSIANTDITMNATPQQASAAAKSLRSLTLGTPSTSESVFVTVQQGEWLKLRQSCHTAGQLDRVANSLRACWMMGHWIWWKYLRTNVPIAVRTYLKPKKLSQSDRILPIRPHLIH